MSDELGNERRTGATPVARSVRHRAAPVTPQEERLVRASVRLRRVASGVTGRTVLFTWACFEALLWPLIPDSALMGMAFSAPRRLLRNWVATVSGTLCGGLLGLGAARAGLRWPLPLVTDRMRDAADGWLADGAAGLWHQPLSGVPYKTFVQLAADHDVETISFLVHTAGARGLRMLAMGAVGAAAGLALQRWIPARSQARVHVLTIGIGSLGLLVGLALVIRHWS